MPSNPLTLLRRDIHIGSCRLPTYMPLPIITNGYDPNCTAYSGSGAQRANSIGTLSMD